MCEARNGRISWQDLLARYREEFPGDFLYSEHPTPSVSRYFFNSRHGALVSQDAAAHYMTARMMLES